MISPASGIRRPSYNGAPAKQTWTYYESTDAALTQSRLRRNVCNRAGCTAHCALG